MTDNPKDNWEYRLAPLLSFATKNASGTDNKENMLITARNPKKMSGTR